MSFVPPERVFSRFYQPRSLAQILREGWQCYTQHGWTLTQPILLPLLMQFAGVVLWVGLAYAVVQWGATLPPWALWVLFLAANLPGLLLFLRGFWVLVLWACGLNLLVREFVDTQCLSEHSMHAYLTRLQSRSVDLSLLGLVVFAFCFVPLGLAILPVSILPNTLGIGLSAIVFLLTSVLALVALLYCCLVVQCFTFQPGTAGATLFRSADLVGQNWRKALLLCIITLLLTQLLWPAVWVALADGLQLSRLLADYLWQAMQNAFDPSSLSALPASPELRALQTVYGLIWQYGPVVSLALVRLLLGTLAAALTLPLGSCWFALLYADCKARLV